MERHYLSDSIDTCGFFCKERGRLCIGLLRVCASVLAQQNNLTVSVTRELQEFIRAGAIIGDGDRKRAPFLVLGLVP